MNDREKSEGDFSLASEQNQVSLRPDKETRATLYGEIGGRRPIVVVLGMHRSGTSLLSNMLHMLGVDMADTTDHVSPKNPGGFWERPELVAIHDEILEAIGQPIARPSHVLPFPAAWWRSKQVQALKPKLLAYVAGQLAKSANPWGFKDPRTCRLLPLWWEVFRELNLEPVYVNAIRAPDEAAVSMSQKSSLRKVSVANGELMWLSYNYDVARLVTLKSPALVVDYAEWFSDPSAVAERLCHRLGIGQDLSAGEIDECVSSIVKADYRHQFAEEVEDSSLAGMFYNSLRSAASPHEEALRNLRGQVRLVEMFFKSVAPVIHDLDETAAAKASLETERDELSARVAAADRELVEQTGAAEAREQIVEKRSQERTRRERKRTRAVLRKARQTLNSLAEQQVRFAKVEQLLEQERAKTRSLATSLQEWRDIYAAEHGEPDERILAAQRNAELQTALAQSEKRLALAQEERERFIAELEARDLALAALSANQNSGAARDDLVFTWPEDGSARLAVEGGVDKVDEVGIAGHLQIDDPSVVPIVEVRVDEQFVTAQVPTPSASGHGLHFRVPWTRFSLEHAGKEAVVLVSGLQHELGRAAVPADLRDFLAPPSAQAAARLGGTMAEAAEYHRWILETEEPADADAARAYRSSTAAAWPMVTVIVFGRDADEEDWLQTLRSLREQVYAEWQVFAVGAPSAACDMDPRIRHMRSEDVGNELDHLPEDALISFVQAGDLLNPTALLHLADGALANPGFELLYSDEDRIDPSSGLRAVPHMKAAWSPDLALAQDYVSRLALVRRSALDGLPSIDTAGVYLATLKAALSGKGAVVHLPFVLYHRTARNAVIAADLSSVRQSIIDTTSAFAGAELVSDDTGRTKIEWPVPSPEPKVSLIVPTRDGVDLLRTVVGGFLHETRYQNLEVLIADNDSTEEETKVYLAKVATHPRVRVVPCPGPFNFSKINNLAAAEATGELIGLMNNDLKVLDPDWLSAMVRHAVRPDVGIVGAKLLYEDGTIQHAGITLGISLASHLYKSAPSSAEGRDGRLSLTQDVSGVTAACLLIRRDVWDQVGGLDEDFPVAYNDVDLCLKVRAAGYRILWTPDAVLYHLESKSRGKDTAPEKRERLDQDKQRLIDRWGDLLSSDPFHSPNLSAKHVDARLAFPPRAAAPWQPAIAAQ